MLKDYDSGVSLLLSSSEWEEAFGRPDCVVVDEEGFCDRRVVLLDEVADEQVLVHCGHEARPSFVVGDLACDDFQVSCGMSENTMTERKRSSLGSLDPSFCSCRFQSSASQ